MAERDARAAGPRLPRHLGNIAVEVTDASGVTRRGGILWASAGWGQVNFVIPTESAVGPARMTIVRDDGSRTGVAITVADVAPGFWTGVSCRGPASGYARQIFEDGRVAQSLLSQCKGAECKTVPVPMARGSRSTIVLKASGFRYATSADRIVVTLGGVRLPVISYGPAPEEGMDQVTLEIPASLRGLGEADLIAHVDGRVSNAVQVRVGGV
jgi:uncharacterized protein (TIGR03437 family)